MSETVRKTPNGLHVTYDDGRNVTRDLLNRGGVDSVEREEGGRMKPTDEERREVARRLRDNADESLRLVVPWAVFNDADEHGDIELNNRLADLIEPERDRTCVVEHRGGGVFHLSCGHDSTEHVKPDYCPTCGARVVD